VGLIPDANELEGAAEKAEDHLSQDVTSQVIPALIKALADLASKKRITVTIQAEDRV
jgi:hypothetical protein